jgi:hypothetical protein
LAILMHLSTAFLTSLIYFSHLSQWLLVSLSFSCCPSFIAFTPFSVDSIISLHSFLHLFQLFFVSSQLLITFAHMPIASLFVASCTVLLLLAFPSCASDTFFTCSSQSNLLLLTSSFTSHAFSI